MQIYLILLAASSITGTYLLLDMMLNTRYRILQQRINIVKSLDNNGRIAMGYTGFLSANGIKRLEALLPKSLRQDNLELRLEQADLKMDLMKVQLARFIITLVSLAVTIVIFLESKDFLDLLLWGSISFMAFISPEIILRGRKLQRQEKIMRELPDFMDVMRIYVSSGLSIYQTIKETQNVCGPTMRNLLKQLSAEMEIYEQEKALRNFASRTDLPELKNFVLTLEQGLASGVPLKEVFMHQSQQIREIRRLAFKKRLKRKPTYLALVGGLLFINIFIIIGLPAVVILMSLRGIN